MEGSNAHGASAVEIVLVEDNPRDAELTRRALERHNLANRLVWLQDGAEALDFFLGPQGVAANGPDGQPRVILLDLKLPRVDGHDVLRRLKADARTRVIPVVVLTSSGQEIDIVRSYELGVNSYIVKPVDFKQFTEQVATLGKYWMAVNRIG